MPGFPTWWYCRKGKKKWNLSTIYIVISAFYIPWCASIGKSHLNTICCLLSQRGQLEYYPHGPGTAQFNCTNCSRPDYWIRNKYFHLYRYCNGIPYACRSEEDICIPAIYVKSCDPWLEPVNTNKPYTFIHNVLCFSPTQFRQPSSPSSSPLQPNETDTAAAIKAMSVGDSKREGKFFPIFRYNFPIWNNYKTFGEGLLLYFSHLSLVQFRQRPCNATNGDSGSCMTAVNIRLFPTNALVLLFFKR